MKIAKLIQEYKLQRKATIDTRVALHNATQNITSVQENWQEGTGPYSFYNPKGKCIQYTVVNYTDDSYDFPVTGTLKHKEECDSFKPECKCSKCKTYEDYLIYRKALLENEIAEKELKNYPFWIKFLSVFQRNK